VIHTCPFCLSMFEAGSDIGVEPCVPCYRAGKRIDSCGNRYQAITITVHDGPHRINSTAGSDMNGMRGAVQKEKP